MTSTLRFASASVLLLAAGCQPDKPDDTAEPIVCAGPSVSPISEQTVTLGDDRAVVTAEITPCGAEDQLSFAWIMDTAPLDSDQDTSLLSGGESPEVTWEPDVVGTYVLTLAVTDQNGLISQLVYAVINVVSGNEPPLADCGANKTAVVGDRVDLDGSASSDPEGAAVLYDWSLSSGPDGTDLGYDDVFNGDKAVATVVPDVAGTYVISLVVSDGENWSDPPDYCSITVASENSAPIADAGDSSALSPCTPPDFHLDGWGSYDPDGDALTFAWTLLTAPAGSAGYFSSDAATPDPYFRWDIPGEYVFELQVCDGGQCSAPDVVTYLFADETENSPPTANAGADQTISKETDCETDAYVFTCEECPADSVTIDGSASIDEIDGDELDFYWTEPTGEPVIAAPLSPTTEVSFAAFPAIYATTTTKTYEVTLAISDCSETDTDTVIVSYTCIGTL
ncbi:MAG: hypothetical protein EXR71_05630 [Myxococcales bacterium]|nr:hypothetical protein [Myxococcales bacterium]